MNFRRKPKALAPGGMVVSFDEQGIAWIPDADLDAGVSIVSLDDGDGNVRIYEGRFETPGEAILAAEQSCRDQEYYHGDNEFFVREVRYGPMNL